MNGYANNLRHMATLAQERGDDATRIVLEAAANEIDRLEKKAEPELSGECLRCGVPWSEHK
jgi:hypothetical protein